MNDVFDIVVKGLNKSFGGNHVLRDMDLAIRSGETFGIIGQSGCGKSVFLKHLIGLLRPDSGRVTVLGKDIYALGRRDLEKLRVRIGMIFQSAALLNSLTVEENISLSLVERGGYSKEEIKKIVEEKLELVGMSDTEKLMPAELSGGMRKRVGVARTLAMNPEVILYDEPTTGLDPVMSDNVDDLIQDMKEKVKVTAIVVTHDMISVMRVADRIGMFHGGRIIEIDTPDGIRNSKNPIVQNFISRHARGEAGSDGS